MNGLSHAQAQRLILATLDGLLDEAERAQLEAHLAACETCRTYQAELSQLETSLRQTGQAKLENLTVPPAARLNIQSNHRKNLMKLRTANVVKGLAALAVLALVAFGLTLLIPQMKQVGQAATPTPTSQPIPLPQTLSIDPSLCKPFDDPGFTVERPPLQGFELIQGAEFEQGGFSYKLWLYCDPSYGPEGKQNLSAIDGMVLYAAWKYTGTKNVNGLIQDYMGFEPDVAQSSSGDGSLSGASAETRWGINLLDEVIRKNIQSQTPFRYRIAVNSPLGMNGAVFSFKLEPTEKGLIVTDLTAEPYDETTDANLVVPNNRLIALEWNQSGNSDIYTMRADGSGLTNLTNHPATDRNPIWSPDGKRIAFESDREGKFDVFVMKADGSELINVSDDPAYDELGVTSLGTHSPWSPDGQWLMFHSNRAGQEAAYIKKSDGSGQAIKFSDTPAFAVWSSNGHQILYADNVNDDQPDTVYLVDAEGRNQRVIRENTFIKDLSWFPNGQAIYLSESDANGTWDLQQIDLTGSEGAKTIIQTESMLEGGMAWFGQDGGLIYSISDPMRITHSLYRVSENQANTLIDKFNSGQICTQGAENSPSEVVVSHDTRQALAYTNCQDQKQLILTLHDLVSGSSEKITGISIVPDELYVTWSGDDRYAAIRILSGGDENPPRPKTSLYLFDRGTAKLSLILEQENGPVKMPALQPVSVAQAQETENSSHADRLVAYASSESGNSEIYLTRTDGGPQVDITNNPAYDANPVWSPNGRQIAFESERDDNREVYVMDFDGNNIIRLTNDPANDVLSTEQVWSPDGTRLLYKNDRAGKWDLFVVKVDGSGTLQLTPNSDSDPEYYYWSPDSQKVAYITGWSINNPQLHLVNADGSGNQLVPLDRMPYSFSLVGWAADSQSVYYSGSVCSGSGDSCLPMANRLYQISLGNPKPVVVAASGPTEARRWVIEPKRIIYLIDQSEFMSTTNRGYDHWTWWQVIDKNATKLNDWPNLQEKCQEPDVANLQIYLSASASSALIGENLPDMVMVVYCGKDDRTWLYRFSPDGAQITLLNQTALVGQVNLPRLSADGKVLLYDLYDQQQLIGSYVLNVPAAASDPATAPVRLAATQAQAQPVPFAEALSANPTPVTASTPTAQNPDQLPTKDLIVFVRSEGTTSALYVMQKDGSNQRRLTKTEIGSIFNPRWSPDGTQILFEGWDGSSGSLYLIGLDGAQTKLAKVNGPAAWSPDGTQIAYLTEDELRVIGLDGKTIASAPLSKFTGETDYWTQLAVNWTADGRAVQTVRTNNQGSYPLGKSDRWWVYEMDAATGEVRTVVTSELPIVTWHGDLVIVVDEKSWQWQRAGQVISTTTPGDCSTLAFGPTSTGANWSPDGKWVLFAIDCYGQGNPDLYVMRADGSDLRLVVKGAHTDWWRPINWSPDNRYLIFGADLDSPGNYDIYSLDLKTPDAKPVRLTNSGFSELDPIWQP